MHRVQIFEAEAVTPPPPPPAGYTPSFVENVTTASSMSKSGSLASDSSYLWLSFIVNFNSNAGTSNIFVIDGRTKIKRINDSINFEIKSTSNAVLFDNDITLAAGDETHVFFAFNGVAGTAQIWFDGVEQTWDGAGTASTGTVDHTRSAAVVLGTAVVNAVADFLIGTGVPPAVSSLYNAGYVDVSGVTADVSFIGDAAFWNSFPQGFVSLGNWTDVP